MLKILVAECKQEVSSFNPVTSHYQDFRIQRGDELFAYHRGIQSEIVGAGLEHYLTTPDGVTAAEWFERWLGSDWQPGQPLPESAKPADGQVLRLVHLADEGETKRKIIHEDFGD